jgi:hypothetical protein
MEDVVGESNVPIFITKEGVEFAKGRILLLITPCEFSVLKIYLFKVASIKGIPESHNTAPV